MGYRCPMVTADTVHDATLDVLAQTHTITAWVRPSSFPAPYNCFVTKPMATGVANTFSLGSDPTGRLLFYSHDGVTGDFLYGTTVMASGTWYHAAATYDGTTKRVYLDGVIEGTSTVAVGLDMLGLVLCADRDSGTIQYRMDGDIDEVRVYGSALSDAEIAALAQE